MSNRRYMVYTKSGRKFMVEEFGDPHVNWGNVIPGSNKVERVTSKTDDIITEANTQITTENGFKNICMLAKGTSPLGYIDLLDSSGIERIESEFVKYES